MVTSGCGTENGKKVLTDVHIMDTDEGVLYIDLQENGIRQIGG